jgi:hypothetical protein
MLFPQKKFLNFEFFVKCPEENCHFIVKALFKELTNTILEETK